MKSFNRSLVRSCLCTIVLFFGWEEVSSTVKVLQWAYPKNESEIARNCQIILQLSSNVDIGNYDFVLSNQNQDTTDLKFQEKYCHPDGSAYVLQPEQLLNIGDTVQLGIDPGNTIDTNRYPFPMRDITEKDHQKRWFVTRSKGIHGPEWGSYFNYQLMNFRNLPDLFSRAPSLPKLAFKMEINDPNGWTTARIHRGDTCPQYPIKVKIDDAVFLIPSTGCALSNINLPGSMPCDNNHYLKKGRSYQIQLTLMDYTGNKASFSKTRDIKFEQENPADPKKNPRMVKNINPDGPCEWDSLKRNKSRISTRVGFPVRSSRVGDFKILGDSLYFLANHYQYGREPWFTNGTKKGTRLLKDMHNGTNYTVYYRSKVHNDRLYWIAHTPGNRQKLWCSDGTLDNTNMLFPNQNHEGYPLSFKVSKNKLYFKVRNEGNIEYWRTDGSKTGTQEVASFPEKASKTRSWINLNGGDLFLKENYEHDSDTFKLWHNSIDSPHYTLLHTFSASERITLNPKFRVNGQPYFNFEKFGEFEFYTVNENLTGIRKAEGVLKGLESLCTQIYQWKGKLFFGGSNKKHGCELMIADSLYAHSRILKDINQTDEKLGKSKPGHFRECNGKLFFTALSGRHDRRLWVTDGTTNGTQLIQEVQASEMNDIEELTCYNNRLYFISETEVFGKELWTSDGTKSGTHLLCDIAIFGNGVGENLQVFNGALYFQGKREGYGNELWKYNDQEPINLH